jgi:hypothetical protein
MKILREGPGGLAALLQPSHGRQARPQAHFGELAPLWWKRSHDAAPVLAAAG